MSKTEDEIRNSAEKILGFDENEKDIQQGTGQITTFNQLGFKGISDKPDGWYLPKDTVSPAIILETKAENIDIYSKKCLDELKKNCAIVAVKYAKHLGILYNGTDVRVFKNGEEIEVPQELQKKDYYLNLFAENKIDKRLIYTLTSRINNCLHRDFGIKNLYHRMIFTACALVAKRYGAALYKGMDYPTFHTSIHSTLSKSLEDDKKQNQKLDLLLEVYAEIKMNTTENQEAIDNFIEWVTEISDCLNSNYWRGEDVMGIFFNEFNRYKKKSDAGQVFTPEHITSFMYRLIDVHQDDCVLDAACGSGGFLVKAMSMMMEEAGGPNTRKAKHIKREQLYGIEFDRELYALVCANMLIHKDGKTNLEHLDSRTVTASDWMKSKPITKVLMNPPFETKFGCLEIVKNVLDSVPIHTECAFILPDKKMEKDKGRGKKIIKAHTLKKIIKLPEKTFNEGVTASIFIFEAGIPQNDKKIFGCYVPDDGLETVKNQGRQDIKGKWAGIEDKWVDIIHKQSGDDSIEWIDPKKNLSYQMPEKPFEIYEEDFMKTAMDYLMFEQGVDVKEFGDKLVAKTLYASEVIEEEGKVRVSLTGEQKDED